MNNYTYYFELTAANNNSSARLDPLIFKGPTTITFNFDNVYQNIFPAFKLNIDWGDGSDRVLQSGNISILTGLTELILQPISYTYIPSVNTYFTSLTAQVQILFANFTSYFAVIPMTFAQTSFFQEYETLDIIDAQFVDNSTNSIFAMFQTNTNNIHNAILTT